ncbi:MAG: fibronectin type III domain-containing protein [Bacillota bacterium]|nr:fibronectin type III domain-containing protein [Bacillota bacterium]
MKKIFAAFLAAMMLMTFLPLVSQPARAAGVTFDVHCPVDPAEPVYLGETIRWWIKNISGYIGSYECRLDIYKDGQLISEGHWNVFVDMFYKTSSPGKYKVLARVKDLGDGGKEYSQYSDEITVVANPYRITKVEPLGASSLRITWNKVPGAIEYELYRSTDMKNWDLIKETTDTSFTNTYLKAGTRYFYKLRYFKLYRDWCELSPIAAGVPMAKTHITSLTSPSARRIRMTWAKAAGASGYQVAMATSANGNYKTVRIVTGGTTAIFSGVRSGSALFFKVRPYRRIYTTTYWGQYSAYRSIKVK